MATLVVDENVIKVLPSVKEMMAVSKSGASAWAKLSRIDVLHEDNSEESYFMKGFKTDKDSHFYICKFYEFTDGLANPKIFCKNLAKLHSSHTSPIGKFGFHIVTYNGDLSQDNTWSDSWEAFFESGFRHVLNIREIRAGPSAELDELLQPFFEHAIPRVLRPLEISGNTIQPYLVHGDIWCGNTAITEKDTEEGIIFDPSSFWGHNEYELGNWRPKRNKFTQGSAPEDDYNNRNALYTMRFNLNAATLVPSQKVYLDMVIDEMRRLIQKFPDGYTGHSPRADILAHGHADATAVR
ncbi:Fructosamine kinase-domain-containing protein [Xylaria venustula]|nr:Fructosamine kinase-domain-containing protein [Xylaria venustula]